MKLFNNKIQFSKCANHYHSASTIKFINIELNKKNLLMNITKDTDMKYNINSIFRKNKKCLLINKYYYGTSNNGNKYVRGQNPEKNNKNKYIRDLTQIKTKIDKTKNIRDNGQIKTKIYKSINIGALVLLIKSLFNKYHDKYISSEKQDIQQFIPDNMIDDYVNLKKIKYNDECTSDSEYTSDD